MRKLIVFNSVSLDGCFTGANGDLSWAHTEDPEFQEFVQGNADLPAAVRKMKKEAGPGMVLMGSGSIVAQLAQERLIDEYQFVVVPVALGAGRTMFEGMKEKLPLKLISTRSFKNGNLFVCYAPG